ncbi:TPR end-of-group domain-containing protein [Aliarcobacter butzleri]|uniref:TPR end-of-group domain-containing protein n=1 Tax=Aliarcobacter butzleri TaxID=28197 RepID=UPI00214B563F|nr:SIR2 family protein [Aliarcobacter butzleri]MCP3650551.1 SIR2 family protein [Arcobacter sp. DNRA7]MCR1816725.1 SIR2 family protein [Aliarcobacter butzleri]
MRSLGLDEFVDEIYEDVQKNSDSKYVFFLGAGCSVSSGINLAKDLAKNWYEELKKQKTKFDNFNEINEIDENNIDFGNLYFEIFETLFPTPLAQQKEIQKITEGVTPSLGYYVLSEFMQKPQFNTIITTNFDNLIQDALIYSGNKRALVITHQDLAKFIERNDTPLITKIHGDAHIHPFNNSNDTKEIPEDLKVAIQGLFINAKLIFIGYRGNDESIANLLEGCKRIDQVYWFGSNEPIDTKLKKWWEELKIKTHIKERDFDKIMSLIKGKFKIEKPDFKKRFEELEECYNKAEQDETKNIENIENKTYIDYLILGNNYYEQKDYYKAIKAYKEASILNPNDSSIFYNWGISIYNLAKAKNDKNLYFESLEKFETASKLNSKVYLTFYNWGVALYNLAKLRNDNEALYNEALKKLTKAIELGSGVYNLACFYSIRKNRKEALELLEKALENKEIKADYVEKDEDWDNFKEDEDFKKLIEKYR